jgi:hypothetical protein
VYAYSTLEALVAGERNGGKKTPLPAALAERPTAVSERPGT